MRIVRVVRLIECGRYYQTDEWQNTRASLFKAIEAVDLWAATLNTLNDPCEAIVDMKEFPFQYLIESEMSFLRRGGICSFAQSPLDPRSWACYAASYYGYCVEYDAERLLGPGREGDILLEIQYMDVPPIIDLWEGIGTIVSDRMEARRRVAQAVVGTEARGWQHEGEWRLVTNWPGRVEHDLGAVTGVYFGYKMNARTRERLSRRLERRSIPLFQVTPSAVSYELHAKRL